MSNLSKRHLIEMGEAKLADARLLYANGRYTNAYYLAGYAVELMLKAILSARFQADTIPSRDFVRDIYTHDLNKLLSLADLRKDLAVQEDSDPQFHGRWEVVLRWSEASRYETWDEYQANELIEAVDDPGHGVLQWLKTKL